METINNVAAAASKAIWGEQKNTTQGNETVGTEPLSGQIGKGTANEPYDQGNSANTIPTTTHPTSNIVSSNANSANASTHASTLPDRTADKMTANSDSTFGSRIQDSDPTGPHDIHTPNKLDPLVDSDHVGGYGNTAGGGLTGKATHTSLNDNTHSHTHGSNPAEPHEVHFGNKADPRVNSDRIGSQGNTTEGGLASKPQSSQHDTSSSILTNPLNAAIGGAPKPLQETDKTGVIGSHGDPFKTTSNIASESKPNTGTPSSDAGLVMQQTVANPNDEPTGHQKSAVKEGKEYAEDLLRMKDPKDRSGEPIYMHTDVGHNSSVPKTQEERRESKVGNPGGQEHGKETSEGTGEQWIKTSGTAADGGDFDATKPGAGREADRLMELKGIHKTEPGKTSMPLAETSGHGSHGHGEKEKVPLGQKIKEKLHIGSKDK